MRNDLPVTGLVNQKKIKNQIILYYSFSRYNIIGNPLNNLKTEKFPLHNNNS